MDNNYEEYESEQPDEFLDDEVFYFDEYLDYMFLTDAEGKESEKNEYKEWKNMVYALNVYDFTSEELFAEVERIPAKFWTLEMAELLIRKQPLLIQSVPLGLRNEKLFELALSQSGSLLEFLPEELLNEKLCEIAVLQNSEALEFVPSELRSEKLYEIAAEGNPEWVYAVPDDKKTDRIRQIEKELKAKEEAERKEEEFNSEVEEFKNKYLHSEATLEEVRDEVRTAKEKLEKLEKMLREHGIDISEEKEGNGHE